MRVLEGGCQVPIGAYARFSGGNLVIDAMVASLDGSKMVRSHHEATGFGHHGDAGDDAADGQARNIVLAQQTVEDLIGQGAVEILEEVREQAGASTDLTGASVG